MRFKGKNVLVTGASQNTGLGAAAGYISEGAFVYVNCLNKEEAGKAEKFLDTAGLSNYKLLIADIADEKQVNDMFACIREHSNRLDILINNACDQGIGTSFENLTHEGFSRIIKVNLVGTFQVSLHAVRMMLLQPEKGVIINLGSNVSMRAIHDRTAYVSSKGAIEALTRSMAIDLGPKGIRVNAVAPGYINTNRWDVLSESTKARRRKNIPLGVESSVEDIVNAIMFLTSDAARTINGERLVVDGGCSAQHMPGDIDL